MNDSNSTIKNHIYKNGTPFDVHIVTLSEKTTDYDCSLWIKYNDEMVVEDFWQDFKSLENFSDYDHIIFGVMSLIKRMGNISSLSLELREVENYLKFSNDQVSIKNIGKYITFYDESIKNIIKNSVNFVFLRSGMSLHLFDTYDYEEKINALSELSQKISNVTSKYFSKTVKVELVSFAESKAVYEFQGIDISSKYFSAYLEGLLQYLQLTLSTEDFLIIAQ